MRVFGDVLDRALAVLTGALRSELLAGEQQPAIVAEARPDAGAEAMAGLVVGPALEPQGAVVLDGDHGAAAGAEGIAIDGGLDEGDEGA
jgi:hypothetical protein